MEAVGRLHFQTASALFFAAGLDQNQLIEPSKLGSNAGEEVNENKFGRESISRDQCVIVWQDQHYTT